ncbi:MAG TPA: DinB family protein [Pyrinomonadaceae bacterium]
MAEKGNIDSLVLRDLWEHHWWSFEKFLETVRSLSDEEFRRDLSLSFNSVHGILAHLIGAEQVWLKRVAEGESMSLVPGVNELPDLASIEQAWAEARVSWRQILDADDLERELIYSNTKGQEFRDPVWRVMTHLVDHSAAYRGILIAALRLLGHPPPTSGVIFYVRQLRKL